VSGIEHHMAGPGGLFDTTALCGATFSDEPEGVLRLHSIDTEVTCVRCQRILLRADA